MKDSIITPQSFLNVSEFLSNNSEFVNTMLIRKLGRTRDVLTPPFLYIDKSLVGSGSIVSPIILLSQNEDDNGNGNVINSYFTALIEKNSETHMKDIAYYDINPLTREIKDNFVSLLEDEENSRRNYLKRVLLKLSDIQDNFLLNKKNNETINIYTINNILIEVDKKKDLNRIKNVLEEWLDFNNIRLEEWNDSKWKVSQKQNGKRIICKIYSNKDDEVILTNGFTSICFNNYDDLIVKIYMYNVLDGDGCYFNNPGVAIGRILGAGFVPMTDSDKFRELAEVNTKRLIPEEYEFI